MSYNTIITETRNAVGVVKLNRPESLNALSSELMLELSQAVSEYDKSESIHVIVVTGNEKAFAAGADIKEIKDKSYMDIYRENFITESWEEISRCRKPVIAAVSGYALGGGCELAMMCDFILASDTAKFGQPEVNIGVFPGAGGTQRLPRLIGKSKSMEMCLTGRMMDAEEAERTGLAAKIIKVDRFMEEVLKIAEEIASKSLPSLMATKECINRAFEAPLAEGLLFERRQFHAMFATEDQKEGMNAFAEKRQPQWKHR